jgi:NO-binding membrane sensor protein with MHYT domain
VAEVHHFTYGWFTPAASFLLAFMGALLGLAGTARAGETHTRGRSTRWLVLASISLGGAGIWLTHFMAMFGFDLPGSPVRYEPLATFVSLGLAIIVVYTGLFVMARRRHSVPRLLAAGLVTGFGIAAMHYAGLGALRVAGEVRFDPGLAGASAVIAVVTTTVALWLAVRHNGWPSRLLGTTIMAVGLCGTHYTAMAALWIRLYETPSPVTGIGPALLIVPITALTAITVIAMVLSGLQATTRADFDGSPAGSSGAHAEVPWKLEDHLAANANLSAPVPVLTPTDILPPAHPPRLSVDGWAA